MASLNSRMKAKMRRHTAEGVQARRMYESRPEVKLRKQIKRAMKKGR